MRKILCIAAATLLSMCAAQSASAVTRFINGDGTLVGAAGVIVNGASYNVTFIDGTCSNVYGSCESSAFDFDNATDALAAAAALRDQVLLQTPAWDFDGNPALTLGCTENQCASYIAYGTNPRISTFNAAVFNNASVETLDYVANLTGNSASQDTGSSANGGFVNFARFARVAAVPEPATWSMMLAGLGMVAGTARYRRRSTATTYA